MPRGRGAAAALRAAERVTGLAAVLVTVVAAVALSAAPADHVPGAATALPGSSAVLVDGAVPARGASAADRSAAVRLRSRVTRVAGHLSDVRRARVARQARATVEDYLERAFTTGDHPFRDFLPGLRRAAHADAPVLRGAGTVSAGTRVSRASAWFSVSAPQGRSVGVTARLTVEMRAPDGSGTDVTGRLLLTRQGRAWRVFGYDLARSQR